MGDYAAKGHDLVKKAEKKLNSFGLFGGFGNKYEDAAEMLEKAGNQFKLAKACEDCCDFSLGRLSLGQQGITPRRIVLNSKACASQGGMQGKLLRSWRRSTSNRTVALRQHLHMWRLPSATRRQAKQVILVLSLLLCKYASCSPES